MYGVVGESGEQVQLFNAHHDDYGEVTTSSVSVAKISPQDVSIHTALATWEIYTTWKTDNASIGIGVRQEWQPGRLRTQPNRLADLRAR